MDNTIKPVTELNIAAKALELQSQLSRLSKELDDCKNYLRVNANGSKKEILVDGVGKVHVSAPFAGSSKTITVFNEEKLQQAPKLRSALLEKGVIEEKIKNIPATVAKVTIKLNV